ncbi:MAG: hypothetical protein SFU25_05625 [Candidatus Caenarcaniphilales bacterium]|nr:hypothetical protein [Candidatus Caenarcaniphilales bacterium]
MFILSCRFLGDSPSLRYGSGFPLKLLSRIRKAQGSLRGNASIPSAREGCVLHAKHRTGRPKSKASNLINSQVSSLTAVLAFSPQACAIKLTRSPRKRREERRKGWWTGGRVAKLMGLCKRNFN